MTEFLLDLASYQEGIDLRACRRTGYTVANIKTSEGRGYIWQSAATYADRARSHGFTVGTFHWLDSSASGAAQANIAYQRMKDLGGPDGMFHQCDCEDDATFAIWRDYINAMQDKLGRHVVNYTGDWWWTARNWYGADLTPYLWAAPNNGYLDSYPGDDSPQWNAGYGGWDHYSVLQYAVQPISGAGGGNISKSAIRDPNVLVALTGGGTIVTPDQEAELLRNAHNADWMGTALMQGGDRELPQAQGQQPGKFVVKNELHRKLDAILNAVGKIPASPVDQGQLATDIANALIASNTNGLTTADHDAVVEDVKKALREGVA